MRAPEITRDSAGRPFRLRTDRWWANFALMRRGREPVALVRVAWPKDMCGHLASVEVDSAGCGNVIIADAGSLRANVARAWHAWRLFNRRRPRPSSAVLVGGAA